MRSGWHLVGKTVPQGCLVGGGDMIMNKDLNKEQLAALLGCLRDGIFLAACCLNFWLASFSAFQLIMATDLLDPQHTRVSQAAFVVRISYLSKLSVI